MLYEWLEVAEESPLGAPERICTNPWYEDERTEIVALEWCRAFGKNQWRHVRLLLLLPYDSYPRRHEISAELRVFGGDGPDARFEATTPQKLQELLRFIAATLVPREQ